MHRLLSLEKSIKLKFSAEKNIYTLALPFDFFSLNTIELCFGTLSLMYCRAVNKRKQFVSSRCRVIPSTCVIGKLGANKNIFCKWCIFAVCSLSFSCRCIIGRVLRSFTQLPTSGGCPQVSIPPQRPNAVWHPVTLPPSECRTVNAEEEASSLGKEVQSGGDSFHQCRALETSCCHCHLVGRQKRTTEPGIRAGVTCFFK